MPSACCSTLLFTVLILPLLLSLLNIMLLSPPTPGVDTLDAALRSLRVHHMSSTRLWHIQHLQSLSDFSTVFSTLGHRAKYVNTKLEGEYRAARLPLGVWGTAAEWVLKEQHKQSLPWTGQRFIPGSRMTDPWGDNTYEKTTSGQLVRGDAYFVNYDEISRVDGGSGSVVLDYGSHGGNGWTPSAALMGELRCFNPHLCIGLTGFWFTGGARNGIPYVLYRPGTVSAGDMRPKQAYVPPKKYHDAKKPSKMKKARLERKKRIKEMRDGDL